MQIDMQASQQSGLGDQHLIYFQERRLAFAQIAGGWPPNVNSEVELKEAQQRMTDDLQRLESYLQVNRESQLAFECYGDLLRMAHNLNIPNAAGIADKVLSGVVAENPNNYDATVALASLYVTLHQDLAPKAEALFNRAVELKPDVGNALIYQGLGLACVYQGKWEQALVHLGKYLDMVPTDKRISDLQKNLSRGHYPTLIHTPLNPSPTIAESKSVVPKLQKEDKPWWRLW